ncbi:hypothetical protein BGX28_007155 [Mortierella sp. GBA30]|nr:hypothetical protein BGX28_007155 [Mortierella sp. GBA30]
MCLVIYTDYNTYLYDATTGSLLHEWSVTKERVIVADVSNKGLGSVLILPEPEHDHAQSMDCIVIPLARHASALSTPMNEDDSARAKANMNSTLGVLEQQLEFARKKIQRLQSSLVSKSEIIQDCQDLITSSLRSAFVSAGGYAPESISQTETAFLQKKRQQRLQRTLERLETIVGNTVSTAFHENSARESMEQTKLTQLEVEDCVAGWIPSTNIIWVGTRIRNQSEQPLFSLRLTVARRNLQGRAVSRLDPQASGLALCVLDVDPSTLGDDELKDRSLALKRILWNAVVLHFNLVEDSGDDGDPYHATISIPKCSILDQPLPAWRSALVDTLLPSRIYCRVDSISQTRLAVLLQDGLGLSGSVDNGLSCGSVEEGILATVSKEASMGKGESWTVMFSVRSDDKAVNVAREAAVRGPSFV